MAKQLPTKKNIYITGKEYQKRKTDTSPDLPFSIHLQCEIFVWVPKSGLRRRFERKGIYKPNLK